MIDTKEWNTELGNVQAYFVATVLSGSTGELMPYRSQLAHNLSEELFAKHTIIGIEKTGATVAEWGYEYGPNEEVDSMTAELQGIPIHSITQEHYEVVVNEIVRSWSR